MSHPLAHGGNALGGIKNKFSKEYKKQGLEMRAKRIKREESEAKSKALHSKKK